MGSFQAQSASAESAQPRLGAGKANDPTKGKSKEKPPARKPGAKPAAKPAGPKEGAPKPKPGPLVAAPKAPPRTPAANPDELVQRLLTAWFVRHPDQAFARGWPGARTLTLGDFGTHSTLKWDDALEDAQRDLSLFVLEAKAPLALRTERQALVDWIAAEKLELSRGLVTQDPSGYVQRAYRTLLALKEAEGIDESVRATRIAAVLRELPDYFDDARTSLGAPRQEWVELALLDLADLDEFLLGLDGPARPGRAVEAGARKAERETRSPALRGVAEFRAWLLELHPSIGNGPARLRSNDFARLIGLVSGSELELGEIEARALRDIARTDLAPKHRGPDVLDLAGIAQRAWNSSARALELAQDAKLLTVPLYPRSVEFVCEESLRTRPESAWLRPGSKETLRVWLGSPSTSWSVARARSRTGALQPRSQAALGVRHGMIGEALYARGARASKRPLAAFVGNRSLQEGFGLYALDWVRRIDWIENPLRDDAELGREFDRVRLHEAARLLAALELHAEGLSLQEAAQAFARRTGVDPDTALAEALEARRDPLHGIGYLGWLELSDLERALAAETQGPRGGIRLVLASVLAHPELTPARLLPLARETLAKPR